MGRPGPNQNDESDAGKPAKEIIAGGEPNPEATDLSIRPRDRFHLFPGKKPSTSPSKSDGDRMQCSSFVPDVPVDPARPAGRVEIVVSVRRPSTNFRQELTRFIGQLEKGKKALYDAAMKAEDLEAMLQGLRNTRARIAKKRESLALGKAKFRRAGEISWR